MSDYVQAMETDLYLTLGIDDDANEAEIKCAFEKLEQIMSEDENCRGHCFVRARKTPRFRRHSW